MGYDCNFYLCDESDSHKMRILESYYMSYNFSNSSTWCVEDSHGYTPGIILQQIMPIIRQHETQLGLMPNAIVGIPTGADGWSVLPQVYLYHLNTLRKICENLIEQFGDDADHIFFSVDSCECGTCEDLHDFQGIQRHKFDEDLDDAPDDADDEIIIPFRHPTKGNIMIKTSADALEAYNLHVQAGSTEMAKGFLEIAEELKRRGK